ncbi:MAG TPA: tetratricopeptide repeat protein, partial [Urbifossiella sp.]|nr:tetratricopeptide repeat protein [Urbifossiella sp.]
AIDEKAYGPDHPSVALRLNNLAQLLRDTGRLVDAEPLYRRAISTLYRVSVSIGHPLPNLDVALNNYRSFLEVQNLPADEVARRLAPFQLPVS